MSDLKKNEITPAQDFRKTLERMSDQFAAALPEHIKSDRFRRVVMTAVQNEPKLLTVDRRTLISACMKCAQDGLLPDGRQAALVMFKAGQVVYMPMVGGIIMKILNSGEISAIATQIVYQGDVFRYWVDSNGEQLLHEPIVFGERGLAIGVYAMAKHRDGTISVEVLSKEEVFDVKNFSKAKDGPWNGPFEFEMWKKTAIRRLSKRLPNSSELEQVLASDNESYDLKAAKKQKTEPKDVTETKKTTRVEALIASKTDATHAEPEEEIEFSQQNEDYA